MTTGDSADNREFKKEIIETHSAEETFALGQRIGREALPGQVYTLICDRGAVAYTPLTRTTNSLV